MSRDPIRAKKIQIKEEVQDLEDDEEESQNKRYPPTPYHNGKRNSLFGRPRSKKRKLTKFNTGNTVNITKNIDKSQQNLKQVGKMKSLANSLHGRNYSERRVKRAVNYSTVQSRYSTFDKLDNLRSSPHHKQLKPSKSILKRSLMEVKETLRLSSRRSIASKGNSKVHPKSKFGGDSSSRRGSVKNVRFNKKKFVYLLPTDRSKGLDYGGRRASGYGYLASNANSFSLYAKNTSNFAFG